MSADDLDRDTIQAFADQFFGDVEAYDRPSHRSFALLVKVGIHVLRQYHEESVPTLDDPSSFESSALAGVPQGFALVEGFRENLEMDCPDDAFSLPETQRSRNIELLREAWTRGALYNDLNLPSNEESDQIPLNDLFSRWFERFGYPTT